MTPYPFARLGIGEATLDGPFLLPTGRVWLGAKDRTRLEAIEDLVAEWPERGF